MLNDKRLKNIEDYLNSSDAFPGVELQGGICYFLWDRNYSGDCEITTHYGGKEISSSKRPLLELEADAFVRHNSAISIIKKIIVKESSVDAPKFKIPEEKQFASLVSSSRPFGLRTNIRGKPNPFDKSIKIYQFGGVGYIAKEDLTKSLESLDQWKVFIGSAHGGQGHGKDVYPTVVIGKPFVGEPGSACTETYMHIGPFPNEATAKNVISYMTTRFFRLLVLLNKPAQHATRKVYAFVPMQDFSRSWTDETLYEKYGITDDEIAFINTMIRPMQASSE
jgi:Eco57I restriction-modification methylase